MPAPLPFDELKTKVASGEVDTVVAAQVDMQGRLMGKRFHAEHFVGSAWKETHSCNYLLATDLEMFTVEGYRATSWAKGYGDYVMRPDPATLRLTPWLPGTALVLCDVLDHHTHEEVPHAPRTMLKRQVARLAERGFRATAATELEFFLFRQSFGEAHDRGHAGLQTFSAYNEDYAILQTTKEEGLMRAMRNGLVGAGIPVENTKGEADAGQIEINVAYADALTMADRHAIIKNAAKEMAYAAGHAVTFMAKWDTQRAGNSSHIHLSLQGEAGPAFYQEGVEATMSATMRAFLAGALHRAREITLFLAPYVNSYKRFAEGTFAPTKIVWSMDNRTAGFRVVGEGTRGVRLECRIGGADLNAHLALAALIAAGLDGLVNERELEPAFTGDAYAADVPEVPRTLREAVAAAEGSAFLREAFGEAVIEHYLHAARWEQREADRNVTDYERRRGFERA